MWRGAIRFGFFVFVMGQQVRDGSAEIQRTVFETTDPYVAAVAQKAANGFVLVVVVNVCCFAGSAYGTQPSTRNEHFVEFVCSQSVSPLEVVTRMFVPPPRLWCLHGCTFVCGSLQLTRNWLWLFRRPLNRRSLIHRNCGGRLLRGRRRQAGRGQTGGCRGWWRRRGDKVRACVNVH